MDRRTILKATTCDLTRLPLGARGAFVLSQLDGQLTLEEITEVVGMDLDELLSLVQNLLDVGAVTEVAAAAPLNARASAGKLGVAIDRVTSTGRVDPRAETSSVPPASSLREKPTAQSPKSSPSPQSVRSSPSAKRHLTPRPERRRSRKSVGAQRAVTPPQTTPEPTIRQKGSEPPKATATAARRASKAMKAASRRMNAVAVQAQPAVATADAKKVDANASAQVTAVIAKPPPAAAPPPAPEVKPAPPTLVAGSNVSVAEKVERLRAGALEVKIQGHVDALVKAAEDALRANDVVSAANNYRLALSHRDDPHLRMKFEEVDGRAKIVRFEKNIVPARAAEKEQRWSDAAVFFERAHEAKPDPDVAAAAANALRLSGGDLRRATTLAEQAVARDRSNVAYRIILAEVHLAANRLESAHEVSAEAAALAPKDTRVKDLAALISKRAAKS